MVEEINNLASAIHRNRVIVLENFQVNGDCEVLGEVEVPDKLIKKALNLARAQKGLDHLKKQIEMLIDSTKKRD